MKKATKVEDESEVLTLVEDKVVKATRPQGRSVLVQCSFMDFGIVFKILSTIFFFSIILLNFICLILLFLLITRYKRRERGKLVHAYSSKDLEGILVSSYCYEFYFIFCRFL